MSKILNIEAKISQKETNFNQKIHILEVKISQIENTFKKQTKEIEKLKSQNFDQKIENLQKSEKYIKELQKQILQREVQRENPNDLI